jgi:serine/threonine protein kinase
MVMELCIKGSLYHVLSDPNFDLEWDRLFSFSDEMVKGIDCLHSWTPQVLHRDFKSLNLLVCHFSFFLFIFWSEENSLCLPRKQKKVTDQWHLKVCDFGLARFNTDTSKETLGKMRGTFAYCAPEVYFGERFTTKSDVFSVGM